MRYVAVVGPGEGARPDDTAAAHQVGALVAARGWITLTGGRKSGVMAAAADGARSAGGVSIGLLPDSDRRDVAESLTASIATGLGEARNVVLINSADAVIACGVSAGTLSEIALAIQAHKPVVLIGAGGGLADGLRALDQNVRLARAAEDAVVWVASALDG